MKKLMYLLLTFFLVGGLVFAGEAAPEKGSKAPEKAAKPDSPEASKKTDANDNAGKNEKPAQKQDPESEKEQESDDENSRFDVVILKDGRKIKGIVEDTHGPTIKVNRELGSITIQRAEIKEIIWAKKSLEDVTVKEDTVYLKNGDRITGKIEVSRDNKTVIITKKYKGKPQTIYIPYQEVLKIVYAGTVEKKDDREKAVLVEDVVKKQVKRLDSENELDVLDARKKLIDLGLVAISHLKEIRDSQPLAARKVIDEILFLAELKKHTTKDMLDKVSNLYGRLTSTDSKVKVECLEELVKMVGEEVLSLFTLLLHRDAEPLSVRVYCLNYLAYMDRNVELIKTLNNSNSGRLRFLAAIHLGDNGIYVGVETIINALLFPDEKVRTLAYERLKAFTGEDILFDPAWEEKNRKTAHAEWMEWWSKNKGKMLSKLAEDLGVKSSPEIDQMKADIYYKAAVRAWQNGRADAAISGFKKAFETQPSHVAARLNYALVNIEEKNFEPARREVDIVLKRFAEEAGVIGRKRAYYYLGLIELEGLNWADAKKNFELAIKLDRKYVDARIALGRACFLQARNDEYYKLSESDVKDTKLRAARMKEFNELLDRAEVNLVHANKFIIERFELEKDVEYRRSASKARKEAEMEGKKKGAEFSVLEKEEKALFFKDLQKKGAGIHSMLAEVYVLKNDMKKAVGEMELAVKYDDSNAYLYYRLGALYEIEGMIVKAVEAYRKASELQNGFMPAEEGIVRLGPAYEKIMRERDQKNKPEEEVIEE